MTRERNLSHSWWWDSHHRSKHSKWLQSNLEELDEKVKEMLRLIEEDADSFAKRAELFYQKRPVFVNLVEEVYRTYRSLAERYDLLTEEIHHNVPRALRVHLGLSFESPQPREGPTLPAVRQLSPLHNSSQISESLPAARSANLDIGKEAGYGEATLDQTDEGELSSSESEIDNAVTLIQKLELDLECLRRQYEELLDSHHNEIEHSRKLQVQIEHLQSENAATYAENLILRAKIVEFERSTVLQTRFDEMERENAVKHAQIANLTTKAGELKPAAPLQARMNEETNERELFFSQPEIDNVTVYQKLEQDLECLQTQNKELLESYQSEFERCRGLQAKTEDMQRMYAAIEAENSNQRERTVELEHIRKGHIKFNEMDQEHVARHAEVVSLRARVDELERALTLQVRTDEDTDEGELSSSESEVDNVIVVQKLEQDLRCLQRQHKELLNSRQNELERHTAFQAEMEELQRKYAETLAENTDLRATVVELEQTTVPQTKYDQIVRENVGRHAEMESLRARVDELESAAPAPLQTKILDGETDDGELSSSESEVDNVSAVHKLEQDFGCFQMQHRELLNSHQDELERSMACEAKIADLQKEYVAIHAENSNLRAKVVELEHTRALQLKFSEMERESAARHEEIVKLRAMVDDLKRLAPWQLARIAEMEKDCEATHLERELEKDHAPTHQMTAPAEEDGSMHNKVEEDGVLALKEENHKLAAMLDDSSRQVCTLAEENNAHRAVIIERAEEKREAIRQLCYAIDVLRSRNQKLQHALSLQKSRSPSRLAGSRVIPVWTKVLLGCIGIDEMEQ